MGAMISEVQRVNHAHSYSVGTKCSISCEVQFFYLCQGLLNKTGLKLLWMRGTVRAKRMCNSCNEPYLLPWGSIILTLLFINHFHMLNTHTHRHTQTQSMPALSFMTSFSLCTHCYPLSSFPVSAPPYLILLPPWFLCDCVFVGVLAVYVCVPVLVNIPQAVRLWPHKENNIKESRTDDKKQKIMNNTEISMTVNISFICY